MNERVNELLTTVVKPNHHDSLGEMRCIEHLSEISLIPLGKRRRD